MTDKNLFKCIEHLDVEVRAKILGEISNFASQGLFANNADDYDWQYRLTALDKKIKSIDPSVNTLDLMREYIRN